MSPTYNPALRSPTFNPALRSPAYNPVLGSPSARHRAPIQHRSLSRDLSSLSDLFSDSPTTPLTHDASIISDKPLRLLADAIPEPALSGIEVYFADRLGVLPPSDICLQDSVFKLLAEIPFRTIPPAYSARHL
ncbi:hypothetical protein BGZ46_009589 [Entomortierella lignicola]|nr:hypothetical protein BGZ46_009589 [Entomortierella lignicola]